MQRVLQSMSQSKGRLADFFIGRQPLYLKLLPSWSQRGADVYNLLLGLTPKLQSSRNMHVSDWAVSSVVEHCLHTAGVTSSKLVPPTKKINKINKLKVALTTACCSYGFCTDMSSVSVVVPPAVINGGNVNNIIHL